MRHRYLLPLFSNSVASRKFHARRARRAATVATRDGSPDIGFDTDDERENPTTTRDAESQLLGGGPLSPRPRAGRNSTADFGASMTDFFRSLRGQQVGPGGSGANSPGGGSGSVPHTPLATSSSEFRTPSRGGGAGEPRWGESGGHEESGNGGGTSRP